MNNIKVIAKYDLLEAFFPYRRGKKVANLPENYGLRILYFIATYLILSYLTHMFMSVIANIYLGKPGGDVIYFTYFGIALSLLILVFYTPSILSNFFSDKKIDLYKTLPLSQGELFIGKIIGNVISYVDFFLFFLISLVVYFSHQGFSLSRLVFGIVNFPSLILLAYSIIAGFILLLMRYTNVSRHRKLVKTIGYIILFALIGLAYAWPMIREEGGISSGLGQISQVSDSILSMAKVLFNARLFGLAVGGSISQNIIFTLILIGISLAILYILYKFADRAYYESLADKVSDKGLEKKAKSDKDVSFKQKSQVFAIYKRDIKNLFSNIVFLAGSIPMLIIFGIMGIRMGGQLASDIKTLSSFDPSIIFWLITGGFALAILIWGNSTITSTTLSREHKSFYLFQTLPIDPANHYRARLLSGFTVSSLFNIALVVIIVFSMGLGPSYGLIILLGLSLGTLAASAYGLLLGTKRIITNWNKPEELNKGGAINILYYFITLAIVAILVGLGVFLTMMLGDKIVLAIGIMLVIILALTGLINNMAKKAYLKGFYDIGG